MSFERESNPKSKRFKISIDGTLREAYEGIANDYLLRKKAPWKDLEEFINQIDLENYDILLDLGGGNGRNLHLVSANLGIILDFSQSLLDGYIGPELGQRVVGFLPWVPFRNRSCDFIFLIAVIHHFEHEESVNALLE